MATPLQKAQNDRDSMKGRILEAARRVFGLYGFHGATMRAICREVGIDISTLYYHWGEKDDLYQAVIIDATDCLGRWLTEVELAIKGKPLVRRMDIAIDMMCGFLADNPEISRLILQRYMSDTRHQISFDRRVPGFAADIARSMGLAEADGTVSTSTKTRILGMMMSIYSFMSGENMLRSMLNLDREAYLAEARDALKYMLIPAFCGFQPPVAGTIGDQRHEH